MWAPCDPSSASGTTVNYVFTSFQGCGEFVAVRNPWYRERAVSLHGILAHIQYRWRPVFWREVLQMCRHPRGAVTYQHST